MWILLYFVLHVGLIIDSSEKSSSLKSTLTLFHKFQSILSQEINFLFFLSFLAFFFLDYGENSSKPP